MRASCCLIMGSKNNYCNLAGWFNQHSKCNMHKLSVYCHFHILIPTIKHLFLLHIFLHSISPHTYSYSYTSLLKAHILTLACMLSHVDSHILMWRIILTHTLTHLALICTLTNTHTHSLSLTHAHTHTLTHTHTHTHTDKDQHRQLQLWMHIF
jgi:hypothetical protein